MEIKDHLAQKRAEIVNRVVNKIKKISKTGGEPNIHMIIKEIDDFDEYVHCFWGMTWKPESMEYHNYLG